MFSTDKIQPGIKLRRKRDKIPKAGKTDYRYNNNNFPLLSFPYCKIFFNKQFWFEVFNEKYDDIGVI